MAKKREKKVVTTEVEKVARPVRLDLSAADHDRLEKVARAKGLNKASYARMVILERIKADEQED